MLDYGNSGKPTGTKLSYSHLCAHVHFSVWISSTTYLLMPYNFFPLGVFAALCVVHLKRPSIN